VTALAVVVIVGLGLTACGRKGPLDQPPSAAIPPPAQAASNSSGAAPGAAESPQETAAKTGFDAQGNPIAGPGQKKSFFLDPLLR